MSRHPGDTIYVDGASHCLVLEGYHDDIPELILHLLISLLCMPLNHI